MVDRVCREAVNGPAAPIASVFVRVWHFHSYVCISVALIDDRRFDSTVDPGGASRIRNVCEASLNPLTFSTHRSVYNWRLDILKTVTDHTHVLDDLDRLCRIRGNEISSSCGLPVNGTTLIPTVVLVRVGHFDLDYDTRTILIGNRGICFPVDTNTTSGDVSRVF